MFLHKAYGSGSRVYVHGCIDLFRSCVCGVLLHEKYQKGGVL
jgi:hypothetical protein